MIKFTACELFHGHLRPYLHDNGQLKHLSHAIPLQPIVLMHKSIFKVLFLNLLTSFKHHTPNLTKN